MDFGVTWVRWFIGFIELVGFVWFIKFIALLGRLGLIQFQVLALFFFQDTDLWIRSGITKRLDR